MGWDSNPRYPCGHAGFQDRCLKPLGHPSKLLTSLAIISVPPSAYRPLLPKLLPNTLDCPTGADYAERYLQPLARLPELKDRVHAHAQVVHIGRRGVLKGDAIGSPLRREHPFRLLVRDPGGRESFLHACSLIDASGVYGQPNWAGDGGIPARSELYLKPQLFYRLPDVLGLDRERFAGHATLVIGAGASAATSVAALAKLAGEAPGTCVVWAARGRAEALYPEIADDPLPERRALQAAARALARGGSPAVTPIGGVVVEGFEFNSATHRYRITLVAGGEAQVVEVDQVVVVSPSLTLAAGPPSSLEALAVAPAARFGPWAGTPRSKVTVLFG